MRQSLKDRCDLLLENEAVMRRAARLEAEETSKVAALTITSRGLHASEDGIRQARTMLKKNTSLLSNWRGIMNTVVLAKMSMEDDPIAYFEEIDGIYKLMRSHTVFSYESQAMCAMTIHDVCPKERWNEAVERTMTQYELARKAHPLLTDHKDMPIFSLAVMSGMDPETFSAHAEECYELLKPLFKLYPETKQMTSNILALSDKGSKEKVEAFWSLYEDLKAAKHHMSRNYAIAILAPFVELTEPRHQLVTEIGEVDDYLKGKKGYGLLGVGSSFRRLMAAVLVLQDHEAEINRERTSATYAAITQVIAEQIVEMIITLIVISSVNASSNNSSK